MINTVTTVVASSWYPHVQRRCVRTERVVRETSARTPATPTSLQSQWPITNLILISSPESQGHEVFRLRTIRHWYLGYIYIYHVKSADGLYQKIRCMVYCKKKKERRSTYTQYNIDKKDRRWSNLNILCSALLDLLWRQISTRQTPPIYPNNPQVLCHMIQWLQQFFNVARTCPCNCISHGSSSLPYAISLSRVLAPIASCDSSIIHPAGISSRPCPSSFLYRSVQPPLPISTVCRSVDNKQVGFFFCFL